MATEKSTFQSEVEFLVKLFKFERYLYLSAGILAFILLFVLIILQLIQQDLTKTIAMLFPSSLITISISRFLRMWRDCIDILKITSSK